MNYLAAHEACLGTLIGEEGGAIHHGVSFERVLSYAETGTDEESGIVHQSQS